MNKKSLQKRIKTVDILMKIWYYIITAKDKPLLSCESNIEKEPSCYQHDSPLKIE